jgi:hypothetical protein
MTFEFPESTSSHLGPKSEESTEKGYEDATMATLSALENARCILYRTLLEETNINATSLPVQIIAKYALSWLLEKG